MVDRVMNCTFALVDERWTCSACGANYLRSRFAKAPIRTCGVTLAEPRDAKQVIRQLAERRRVEKDSTLSAGEVAERMDRCLSRGCWTECSRTLGCRWVLMLAGCNAEWPDCARWQDPSGG